MPKRGNKTAIDYNDDVLGVERDSFYEEDFSDICEDYDDDDAEMAFPEEFLN